jgi:uncharacterized protein
MRRLVWAYISVIVVLSLVTFAAFAEVPANKGRITDYSNTLSKQQIQTLAGKMMVDGKSGVSTTAVLIVDSLNGQPPEEYASDVFHAWGLGKRQDAYGLLLVIAVKDRKVRIQTGSSSENKITDIQANRIYLAMVPHLKNSQWYAAIDLFIDQSSALMRKD